MFSLQFFKRILFLILFLIFAEKSLAQTKAKATVSPFLIEERISPGQNFEKEIVLTNQSEDKINFAILVQDIRLDEKGNILLLPPKTERFSLGDWVEVKEKNVELLPGESKEIKVFFKIPEKEAVGSRHGAIIFSSEINLPPQEREGVFATFSHQIGVLVFLYSTSEVKEEAKILDFKTDKKFYFTPFLVKFQTEIENLGNVYIEPVGKIEIKNFLGKNVGEVIFNQQNLKVLPEGKRIFEEIWQGKFGFGKYTATLYLSFGTPKNQGGSGIKLIFAKTFFWIFPLKEFLLIVLISILIGVLLYLLVKRYKRFKKLNEH